VSTGQQQRQLVVAHKIVEVSHSLRDFLGSTTSPFSILSLMVALRWSTCLLAFLGCHKKNLLPLSSPLVSCPPVLQGTPAFLRAPTATLQATLGYFLIPFPIGFISIVLWYMRRRRLRLFAAPSFTSYSLLGPTTLWLTRFQFVYISLVTGSFDWRPRFDSCFYLLPTFIVHPLPPVCT